MAEDYTDYITQGALARGLDPKAALRTVDTEGGRSGKVGDSGTSFGPFQMHVGGTAPGTTAKGLGDAMLAQGLDPKNPYQSIDFALDYAKAHGGTFSPDIWHGLRGGAPGPGEHRWVGDVSGGGAQPLYLGTLEKNFHQPTGNDLLDALINLNVPKEDKTGNPLLDQLMQQAMLGTGSPNQVQPAPDAAAALRRTPQALPPQTVPELSGQQVDIKPMQPLQPTAIAPPEPGKEVVPSGRERTTTEATPPAPVPQPGAAQPSAFQQDSTGNGLLDHIFKQLSPISTAQAAEMPTPTQPPQPQAQPAPPAAQSASNLLGKFGSPQPDRLLQQILNSYQNQPPQAPPSLRQLKTPGRDTIQPSYFVPGEEVIGAKSLGEAGEDIAEDVAINTGLGLAGKYIVAPLARKGMELLRPPMAQTGDALGRVMADQSGAGRVPQLPAPSERIEPPPIGERGPAGEAPSEPLAPKQPEISPPATPPGAPPPSGGEMPPATPVPPPPSIKETAQALDDDLFKAAQSAEADRLQAQHLVNELPDELKGAADEQAYHERESRMTGKPIKPSSTTQRIERLLKPMDDKIHADATWIREHAPDIYGMLQEKPALRTAKEGHVHRKIAGQKLPGEPLDPQQGELITGLGGGGLSRRASGMMHRTPDFVLEDNSGNRIPGKGPKVGEKGGPARYGETFVNPGTGVKYTVKEPTTAELEAKYPNRTYIKSLLANTIDNYLRLSRVRANIEILEKWKPRLYDAGHWFPEASQDNRPANFVHVDVPQLRGWAEPHIAAVLNDIYRIDRNDVVGMLQKANKLLIGSMFALPVRHQLNVGAHYMVGRGADWLYRNPMLARAYQEVAHQGPEYLRYLRAGAGLRYASTLNENFYNTILGKLFHEQMTNPEWEGVFKELGHKAADVVKAEYAWSRRALWKVNDVFLTARIMELEKSGKPLKEAIRIAEEEIPNYRLPTSNLFTRKLIQSPFIAFGRYDYGRARALAKTVENMIGPGKTGEERVRAVAQALIMIGVGYYGYRAGNTALQEGQDKIRTALGPTWGPRIAGAKPMVVGGIGPFGPVRSTAQYVARKFGLDADEKNWATLLGSWMTLAPAAEVPVGLWNNRNTFTGQPIWNEQGTPAGQIGEATGFVAGQINPLELAIESARKGLLPGIGPQFGIQQEYKGPPGKVQRMLRREAMRQEARDPTARLMKRILPKRAPTFGIPPEDFLR